MKVQMKTTMAGPGGSYFPGRVADLPDGQANELIDGGYAVAVGRNTPRAAPRAKAKKDEGGLGLDETGP